MYTKRSYLIHAALLMAVMSLTACGKTEASPSAAATTTASSATAAAVPAAALNVGIRIVEPDSPEGKALTTAEAAKAAPKIPADSYNLKATLEGAGKVRGSEFIDYDSYGYPVENGKKTVDGYPVFLITCDLNNGMCQDSGNNIIGDIVAVSQNLTPVRNADVLRKDWHCNYVCLDAEYRVVGAVQPDMLTYLDKHNLVNGTN